MPYSLEIEGREILLFRGGVGCNFIGEVINDEAYPRIE